MTRIHKLLKGEGAGSYLPFALSRLAALRLINPSGYFSQTFIVDDAKINVRKVNQDEYIDIEIVGGFYFEFQSSANPPTLATPSDPAYGTILTYNPVTVATEVTATKGAVKTQPYIRLNGRNPFGNSRNQRSVQVQLIDESVHHPTQSAGERRKQKHTKALYESYSGRHSHSGTGYRNPALHFAAFQWNPMTGNALTYGERDIGFDEQWSFGDKFANVVTSTYYTHPSADWPRSAGYQTVVDEKWGTRTFGIMVDFSNRFHVFPVSQVRPLTAETFYQSVQDKYTKDAYPPFPTWVWTDTSKAKDYVASNSVDKWMMKQPEYDWKFNLSGTKACAIVQARSAYSNDSTYWSTDQDPDTPWSDTKFGLLRDQALGFGAAFRAYPVDPTSEQQRYFFAPGLVECQISITLTGSNPEDFEIALTATELRDPNTNDYFPLYAGYSWIDASVVNTSADDLIVVDAEMYGRTVRANSGKIDQSKEVFLCVKNLTKNTELWCTKAYQVLGIDIQTLTMALRLSSLELAVPTSYPQNRAGGAISAYKAVNNFGVWIIRSGQTKKILYPETMVQADRDKVAALAVFGQRDTITSLLASSWAYVPLQGLGKDGWNDSDYNTYRRYWAGKKHYYYVDPWVLYDTDWDFHGTDPFADEGWVRYKTEVASPSGYEALEQELLGRMGPLGLANEHLFFCDNPRWGWMAYQSIVQTYVRNHATITFWSHPNGSYAFWCSSMIYDPNGCPALDPITSLWPSSVDALTAYDASLVEHCIFDIIHLEVRGASGTAATLDTTFLEMYNQAVQKGIDDETLEDGIRTMTLANIRGTFEKQQTVMAITVTESINVLQLQYTNPQGRKWYYVERGIQGWYTPSIPTYEWPPFNCANILDYGFDTLWYEQPYDENAAMYASAIDTPQADDQASYSIRFCNPQILMG